MRREAGQRLRLAFDLHATGVAMKRESLRRRHPARSEQWLEAKLVEWLEDRPGAKDGDGVGRPVRWPRRRRA